MISITYATAISQLRAAQPDRQKLKIEVKHTHTEISFGANVRQLFDVDSIGSLLHKNKVDAITKEIVLYFKNI